MPTRIASGSYSQQGWAGTIDDLKRVAQTIDRLLAPRRDVAVKHAQEALDSALEKSPQDSRALGYESLALEYARDRLAEVVADYEIECTWKDGGIEHTSSGPASEVLNEVNPRSTTAVILRAPAGLAGRPTEIVLAFQPYERVRLTVRDSDQIWVRGALDMLEKELRNSRQHNDWFRAAWAPVVVGLPISSLIAYALLASLPADVEVSPPWTFVVGGLWGILSVLSWNLITAFWRRFELLEPGQKQKSVVVRTIIFGAIGQLLISAIAGLAARVFQ